MPENKVNFDINKDVSKMMDVIIASFIRRGLIAYQDKKDMKQELVLFFIENCTDFASEREKVFVSLKNTAINLIKKASYRRHVSLDGLIEVGQEFSDTDTLEALEQKMSIDRLFKNLTSIEYKVCQAILDGLSYNQITRNCHMSKATIYKVFDSLKKKSEK